MSKPAIASIAGGNVNDDTLRESMGYHMKRAFNVIQTDLTRALKPFELRMLTYSALVLIADNPGIKQTQLAAAMDIERPNLVVIIDELEQREWIVRDRVATDRRSYALNTTLAGRRMCKKAVAAVKAHEAKLFSGIDPDTRHKLISSLSELHEYLNKRAAV